MIQLRPYQREAIDAVYAYFRTHSGNPLVVLPTGSGKSLVAASFIKEALTLYPQTRIAVVTHVKELIEQDKAALEKVWPDAPLGVWSASLRRKEKAQVVFAGIQSIYAKAHEHEAFDLVIVDEAHLIPKGGEGRYVTFLDQARQLNPLLKCVGLTATPFRMTTGSLIDPPHNIFTDVAYEATIQEMVAGGYLSRLVSKGSQVKADLGLAGVRNGDYIVADLEAAYSGGVTAAAIDETVRLGAGRKSWLVFCVSVAHAMEARDLLRDRGVETECVSGETPSEERDEIVKRFRKGELRAVTNCMVLTTGFDAPSVDLIAFLRPTKSPGLFVQMAGRGMRLAPGKSDCLCLDFANLVETHGPVDSIRLKRRSSRQGGGSVAEGSPARECPTCHSFVPISSRECGECGYIFPLPVYHEAVASDKQIMSEPVKYLISHVRYSRHEKAGSPPSLRVDYYQAATSIAPCVSEWVCLEHGGYARARAAQWWARRGGVGRAPATVEEAIKVTDGLRVPSSVSVDEGGKYKRIVGVEWRAS